MVASSAAPPFPGVGIFQISTPPAQVRFENPATALTYGLSNSSSCSVQVFTPLKTPLGCFEIHVPTIIVISSASSEIV
jgi:hypothetical protein